MELPSHECKMTFCNMTNATPHRLDFIPIRDLITELDLLPNYEGFHRIFAMSVACRRGRELLRTPGPVLFGTFISSTC